MRIIEISGRLAAHDSRMADWAELVGVECGVISLDQKRALILELDALVAILYGLNENQLRTIYETFHHDGTVDGEHWDSRFNAVMEYYRQYEEVNS